MDNTFTVAVDDGLGNKETIVGTREEIERWFENHLDPSLVAMIITDETGVVGRKLFCVSEIAWGCNF